jgi:hypothetical protein
MKFAKFADAGAPNAGFYLMAIAIFLVLGSVELRAQSQDPCDLREQWVRFLVFNEFFSGRLGLDRAISTVTANVSPACSNYQVGKSPSAPSRTYGNGTPPACSGGVCTLPDGTRFAIR